MKNRILFIILTISIMIFSGCSGEETKKSGEDANKTAGDEDTGEVVDSDAETGDAGAEDATGDAGEEQDTAIEDAAPEDTGTDDIEETDDAGEDDADEEDTALEDTGVGDADASVDGGPSLWEISVVDESPNYKSRAALVIDNDSKTHIAYNIATDPEGWYTPSVWYAVQEEDSWQTMVAAPADGISNEFPNLMLDPGNDPYIFFNRNVPEESQIDLFYVTRKGDGFSQPVNITNTADKDEYGVDIAVDRNDDIHLIFQERTETGEPGMYDYSIGYLKISEGTPSPPEVVTEFSAQPGLNPGYSIAVDKKDRLHLVYCKPGDNELNNVLYYRAK